MSLFSEKLADWQQVHKRDLPWKKTQDPYHIWISEIILQQTRVEQGWDYYLRFIQKFPDIQTLASSSEDEVLKLWQGLGYYSRARNLHYTAKEILERYHGKFPEDYKDVINLKGIGAYTAAAILSFAFNQPYPVLDGNVARIICRIFGIFTPIDSPAGKKAIYEKLDTLIDKRHPADFNQAMMDFGSLQCKPLNPSCESCPFQDDCYAFRHEMIANLPLKSKKKASKNRYLYYFVIHDQKKILLQKRTANDIWKNLFEFPLFEAEKALSKKELAKLQIPGTDMRFKQVSLIHEAKHVLSHQHLHAYFIKGTLSLEDQKELLKKAVPIQHLERYAIPKLIENFLRNYDFGSR